jgi:16S rRNA processing protein RimM
LPKDSPVTPTDIVLAAVAGAHGVTGEVRLKLFGDGVASLKAHKVFNTSAGNAGSLTVKTLRDDGKGGAVARFAEVADRTAAEKLRGTLLTVPRTALPPLAEGEYYHADLLGLAAVSASGEPLGTVIAIDNFGAGDVLEIERPPVEGKRGKRFMVPMRVEAVPTWDHERLIVADDFATDD